ncbi:Stk1 family PASTA domain-containing Ser/Thr kinase [Canibacter sp. lx-72]|uniref:Stk1 family PASTA domain-containing Ser/Thr kinase n=1 Tax=Canibacter zhuwentaonis TaxID=2837491 RepID=UPI001BDD06A2|nr:Stk1 family PASTA domain-containing Ser/Thr kinase [Canibacter zhuwentaonis]
MDSERGYRLVGCTLEGRYLVEQPIARGGMGAVYRARDLRLNRLVAVKSMHLQEARKQESVRRFDREARIAASLSHPNVVNVFDQSHDHEDIPFLVMEYMDGITLRHMIERRKRLTTSQTIKISIAVLSGLAAAHNAGFVHRDVKPENVLIADDGRIKIGDFGLTRGANNNTTASSEVMATIPYMSPELIKGETAGCASDIYSFGIMLYEMLTGVQPYRGENAAQITYKHMNENVPAPSLISAEVTDALDEIVRWCTIRDVAQRPANAAIVLARLKALVAQPNSTTPLKQTQNSTRVLADTAYATTAALSSTQHATTQLLPTGNQADGETAQPAALERAQSAAAKRQRRGKISALLIVTLVLALGGGSWWFLRGPGSLRAIPNVSGLATAEAQQKISSAGFNTVETECTSPDIEPGKIVQTNPGAGSRAKPETQVEICVSIGPKILPVPQLIGATLDEAKKTARSAGFNAGEVVRETFDGEVAGTVVAALDPDGNQITETYREQGKINFVVSAGALPNVAGMTPADAVKTLQSARLHANSEQAQSEFSDDVAKGKVIRLETGESVNTGDTVTLVVSKGPQLREVPNVIGKRMSEAIEILENSGFKPKTAVPPLLRNAVRVKDTDPAAGTEVPLGSDINLGFEL